jgi:hypothetical protein
MKMPGNIIPIILFFALCVYSPANAQSRYLPDKPGGWFVSNQVNATGGRVDKAAYTKNLTAISEWFHQHNPMLKPPKGFDAEWIFFNNGFGRFERAADYSTEGEMRLLFEIFEIENGKEVTWKDECPSWSIKINSNRYGHGGNFGGFDSYSVEGNDPPQEEAFDKALAKLFECFYVFELEREIAPGVRLYKNGNLVVFNPTRPDYWIPVSVKELMDAHLNYWKIKPEWKVVYDRFLKVYNDFTPEELNSPAYFGGADDIVNVTAQKIGLPIMRFNPEYWDRSKPKSTIQFMTMKYIIETEYGLNEYIRNNDGLLDYPHLFNQYLDVEKLGELLK